MRSTSGRGLQGSKRSFDDSPDHGLVGQFRLRRRRGEARVGAQAGIHVNFENRRLAFAIEAEIDARIARQREQVPAGKREVFELGGERGVLGFNTEAARRADIGVAVGGPFGVVADDLGRAAREAKD
jgi:hypothetical protein